MCERFYQVGVLRECIRRVHQESISIVLIKVRMSWGVLGCVVLCCGVLWCVVLCCERVCCVVV